ASASALWQLIAWRTIVGIGMGGEWSSGSVLVAETWPPQQRAKAMCIMQSGWAIGAIIAALISSAVIERFGWRVLFLFGALPAIAAFVIRRGVPEPQIWRERKQIETRWLDIFSPALIHRTLIATLVASSVLVAYWGLVTWLPAFLATP